LPEVVIESPDVERLIAQRVRPTPPTRLGVRLPDILLDGEIPPVGLPARPLPAEPDPDPDLIKVWGRFSRLFGSNEKVFETGMAYWKRDNPVEAFTFFNEASRRLREPRPRAAALFWAAEAALRLGRLEEAQRKRIEILRMPGSPAEPYASAARFALAEERCQGED
jgi:hypothetical protein